MGKTYRDIPKDHWYRTPRYKGKMQSGFKKREIVTERHDKSIAARKEKWDNNQ